MLTSILNAWDNCTELEREYGRSWLRVEQGWCRDVARHYGLPVSMVCGVFAALSPNNSWMSNRRSVVGAIQGDWDHISGYGRDKNKAMRILIGEEDPELVIRGPKTLAFYRLLRDAGNDLDVCIDGHIANVIRGRGMVPLKEVKLTAAGHDAYADLIQLAGLVLDERPCDVMATLWIAWRSSLGFQQARLF